MIRDRWIEGVKRCALIVQNPKFMKERYLGKMQKSGENFAIRLFEGGKFGREINRNDGK
jgi:hypothetical protein